MFADDSPHSHSVSHTTSTALKWPFVSSDYNIGIDTMALSLPKIGILSIGDMGMGIAKLLISKGFSVATNGRGRRSG